MYIILSAAWLAAVAWLVLRALRQSSLLQQLTPAAAAEQACPSIAVIVPARNEADNISLCLSGLLAQDYPRERYRLVVVDDHSTDATPAIVAGFAGNEPRLALLHSPVLPLGWTGKAHACWVGAQAVGIETEWICFIDADMRAQPGLIASAVQSARTEAIDLLSLSPRQELVSFAERLMMPCGLYILAFCQDLERLQANDSADATATGQFMLIRREAYQRIGGHAAVRGVISEDVALARNVKRAGYRVVLKGANRLLSTRMYTGWRTLWPGLAKNLIDMLGGPASTIVTAIAAIILAWAAVLLPAWDIAGCYQGSESACIALAPSLLASAAAFGLHIAGAMHFGIPAWYGCLFPVGYSIGAVMALDSVRQRLTGRVTWKGRTYP